MASTLSRTLTPSLYASVLKTWFGDLAPTTRLPPEPLMKTWFGQGTPISGQPSFDEICVSTFRAPLAALGPDAYHVPSSALSSYAAEREHEGAVAKDVLASLDGRAENALAALLLLDQVPRNVFREEQKVVYTHYDVISRAVARHLLGINGGGEKRSAGPARPDLADGVRYTPSRRMWFYMPLMHSEWKEDHDAYWELMSGAQEDMKREGDDECVKFLGYSLDFEKKHVGLIDRFGRYPHRNEHLGRESTEEEKKYLAEGGETFGTKKEEAGQKKDEL